VAEYWKRYDHFIIGVTPENTLAKEAASNFGFKNAMQSYEQLLYTNYPNIFRNWGMFY